MKLLLVLFFALVTGVFQTTLYAGASRVRFRASDPRSYSAQGRSQITKERIGEAIKKKFIIQYIGSILYDKNLKNGEKIKKISEAVPLFDMSPAQLEEYKKEEEQKVKRAIEETAKAKEEAERAEKNKREVEAREYASEAEKAAALKKANDELAKANAKWSTKKKVLAGLVLTAIVVGGLVAIAPAGTFAGVSTALTTAGSHLPSMPAIPEWMKKAGSSIAESKVGGWLSSAMSYFSKGDNPPTS